MGILVRKAVEETDKREYRYIRHESAWVRSFACEELKVLIVCRGPIRMEAMEVFDSIGAGYGILLSEKDSVTYPHTLAPELRIIKDQDSVHRVPDYTGATSDERKARIAQIINIAKDFGYTHIFAGYGFMAEDAEFVAAIEKAGVGFIGPSSGVHRAAGSKDEAKKLARRLGVSVTPGLDNITAVTLLAKAGGSVDGLKKIAADNGLEPSDSSTDDPEEFAESILQAGYAKGVGLLTLEELQRETENQVKKLLDANPGRRLRLKYIGGGGGKGQRIITQTDQAANAVLEVLSESKAMGDADNKNFLIEMNIENTRHNEIQLIGNGEWAIALGGRDCSLQMHEQKLLELSITDEMYSVEAELARKAGFEDYAKRLEADQAVLKRMEEQAESFGEGVGLDSASTFECIVSDDDFFFMEMNTRIQVEHRVTEMVYSLRFENPDNKDEFFIVESLVEAMALAALHGKKLPRPTRILRYPAGGEVRLNATNDALQPHAGGVIEFWSAPVDNEIRDDQGIGIRNPDTGWFMKYHLAGAYDSNIALLVSNGEGRRENLENLGNILRRTELRGVDLNTNINFHYGIINFMLGMHPMLRPDTGFVVPYLAGVGSLAGELDSFDTTIAWKTLAAKVKAEHGDQAADTMSRKLTLVTRPLDLLVGNPHLLAGWLVLNRERAYDIQGDKVVWKRNPLRVLADIYEYLFLEERENAAPAQKIWKHDRELMSEGLLFYRDLENALGINTDKAYRDSIEASRPNESPLYEKLNTALLTGDRSGLASMQNLDDDLLAQCAAAHRGWQTGLELLDLLILIGRKSGVLEFRVAGDLKPIIPEQFLNAEKAKEFLKSLAPPPTASADQIVAFTGGMFYTKETPDQPRYLDVGTHFEIGQPLYIIEVMKMFNKVYAEFSGTVEEVLVDGDLGKVVKKGQPLFRVKPDEDIHIETEDEKLDRRRKYTTALMGG